MSDQGPQAKKGIIPAPRSAGEDVEETGSQISRKYVLVGCPACGHDISRTCLGRNVDTPAGPITEVYHPLRCPDCHQPLLPLVMTRGIIVAGGPLT